MLIGGGAIVGGCAGGFGGQAVPYGMIAVKMERPLTIPAGRAHTKFQGGRQVRAVDRYSPWCELEIETVSEVPQLVEPEPLAVVRVTHAFIKDYNTRMPALLGGLSCDDLVFQETTWWFDSRSVYKSIYLRCFAPYTNCIFGPPLSPEQMQNVVGNALSIEVNDQG